MWRGQKKGWSHSLLMTLYKYFTCLQHGQLGGMVEIQLELLQLGLFQGLSNLQHAAQSYQKVLQVDNPPEHHVIGKK